MLQVKGLSEDGKQIVLERFDGGVVCEERKGNEPTKLLMVVDVETTGTDPCTDTMIEFAAAEVLFTSDGRIVEHIGTESWLQDPKRPIPVDVTNLTGITNEMVEGHDIPNTRVMEMFQRADLVVSHNAAFDWRFCYNEWSDVVNHTLWGCSLQQIGWSDMGFPSARQEVLARYHGFFYDAHRATVDVEALVRLLQMRPSPDRPRYLAQLTQYLAEPRHRVLATGTPFAAKDELKGRQYRWDADSKVWWTTRSQNELDDELAWLKDLYTRYHCVRPPTIKPIDPRQQWA